MDEAEREDCEGGTDGGEKGDRGGERNGGPREEGDRVREKRGMAVAVLGRDGGYKKEEER